MSKAKRKEVTVMVSNLSFYDVLDGKSPAEVIEWMQELQEDYEGRKISFDVSSYGYDGGLELELWECRLENDKEYEARIAKEKKEREIKKRNIADKDAKEFAEFQRLQKKFGKEMKK